MQYVLMIYGNEQHFEKLSESEQGKVFSEYIDSSNSIRSAGQYQGGNRLDAVSKASTVRVRDGKRLVTDGPFAETKEQLAGYFLFEAKDLDEAISVAARIPGGKWDRSKFAPIIPVPAPLAA